MWNKINYKGIDFLVSDKGEVIRCAFEKKSKTGTTFIQKEKAIKFNPSKYGYLQTTLYKDGKAINFTLHKLVALAFVPNPDNLPQINHKDENKLNNNADNLEWCDATYNINYGTRNKKVHDALAYRTRDNYVFGEKKKIYSVVKDIEKFEEYIKKNKIKEKIYYDNYNRKKKQIDD